MWTNFVKFGHPTPAQADMGYTWEPVTAGDIRSWIVTSYYLVKLCSLIGIGIIYISFFLDIWQLIER